MLYAPVDARSFEPGPWIVPVCGIESLAGFLLGIAGLIRKDCRRGLAGAGLLLNSLILFVFVVVLLWWIFAIEQMIAI